jgi:hypothetical protein
MLTFLARLFSKSSRSSTSHLPQAGYVLLFDGAEIINRRPEGLSDRMLISDLREVVIETNDKGPIESDVWFHLQGFGGNEILFPQGSDGEQAIVDLLVQLPGFDHQTFIKAMSCAENRRFKCWQSAA